MEKTNVVLLPALLCTAELFAAQTTAFKDKAHFTVPDLGTGGSIDAVAARILNHAPQRFVLGGISMGGYIAFEIMRQAPERVAKLILMDTTAAPDAPEKRESRLKGMDLARKHGITPLVRPALIDIMAPRHRADENLQAVLERMASTVGVEGYVNEQNIIMSRPDSRSGLKDIKCPVLVCGGEEDMLTPPESMKKTADSIPDARHVVIKGAGHFPPLEAPEAVNALFQEFLF